MYESFYGFKEKPFSMLPDPGFLFLSKKHQAALTLLEYGLLNHVGFCVITGEPGAGKTTIIRALLERISEDITVGLITNTHQSFGGLLDWVLSAFDLHRPDLTTVEMHQIFMEFLIEEYAKNRSVLLIVDEAQNMQPDTLEELRMLSNVNSEKDQLLQVVLSGQPALKEMLLRPELMQFAQRIAVDYHLEALNAEETCGYIQHRMVTAGAERDVFTPAACERIHNYSGGTPRLINLLCETVLVYGFADQLQMIGVELVDEMVQERMKNSVVPIVNRDVIRQDNTEASEKLEKTFPWIRPQGEMEESEPLIEPELIIEPEVEVESEVEVEPEVEADPVVETIDSTVKEEITLQASTTNTRSTLVENIETEVDSKQSKTHSVLRRSSDKSFIVAMPVWLKEKLFLKDMLKKELAALGENVPTIKEDGGEARNHYVKYGTAAVIFAVVLISAAVMLDSSDEELRANQEAEKILAEQHELEQLQAEQSKAEQQKAEQLAAEKLAAEVLSVKRAVEQSAIEAEKLKAEQLAAKKRAAEKRAAKKRAAEKQAVEQSAIEAEQKQAKKIEAEKAAEKKKIRDEQARIYKIEEKEREARYAAARESRKAEQLAEKQLLNEQEEMRRLEREWLEKEKKCNVGRRSTNLCKTPGS